MPYAELRGARRRASAAAAAAAAARTDDRRACARAQRSITVQADWTVVEQLDFPSLARLRCAVPEPEEMCAAAVVTAATAAAIVVRRAQRSVAVGNSVATHTPPPTPNRPGEQTAG